ncbi:MAG: S-layer homology domain-containing protein [Candidatus Sericytochromatia bacterium]|nr:S-layer homology domain-containing protein [Candidatus Sericytochromatia bacterium]
MHRLPLALLAPIVSLALGTPPALAASGAFKDVPAGHWAEQAVQKVAVERRFMKGYPDDTFQGALPFTRIQLALAVAELIAQLERQTKVSWKTEGLGGYAFKDLPETSEVREKVLALANDYRLFEGVPGVTSQTLEADKQVTRYEMAKVIHRLMRLGETRKVVDPTVLRPQIYAFADVPRSAWSYNEVKEVAERYQVMVGFPDATFRGPEQLTRYQFAASAAQTFPLVVALVERTQERQQQAQAEAAAAGLRFQEDLPVVAGASVGLGGALAPGALVRGVSYFGPIFVSGEYQLGGGPLQAGAPHALQADLGYAIPVGPGLHLQPYVGARTYSNLSDSLTGVSYGALAYWRPMHAFGAHLRLGGATPLQGNAQGTLLAGASAGLWWHPTTSWGLFVEGGAGQWPAALGQAAPAGSSLAPTLAVGAGYRF